ncbi:MAG: sialate O-acetylesterase, partial [Kiritimatiellia bacterium]
MRRYVMVLGLILLAGSALRSNAAEPNRGLMLGAPFADHAVLQQGMHVPVWGWSEPAAQITLTFGEQRKQA